MAFKTSLRPSVFTIPVEKYRDENNLSVSFVPMIGRRKNIGEHFNYELGFGLGVEYFSKGNSGLNFSSNNDPFFSPSPELGAAFTIHLRIGYRL